MQPIAVLVVIVAQDAEDGLCQELKEIIERAVSSLDPITLDASPGGAAVTSRKMPADNAGEPLLPPGVNLEQYEGGFIKEALRRTGGNKSEAARMLGLSRNAFRYRLSKL